MDLEDDVVVISIAAGALAVACCFCVAGLARRQQRHGRKADWLPTTGTEEAGAATAAGKKRRKKSRSPRSRGHSPRNDVRGSAAVREPEGESPNQDQALLETFVSVLSEGLVMRLHGPGGKSKEITLWLQRDDLVWCSNRSLTRRWHKIALRGVQYVEVGRTGSAFAQAPPEVDPDRCLSLVLAGSAFDLEASSGVEREAMAQGFSMLIASVRRDQGDVEAGGGSRRV